MAKEKVNFIYLILKLLKEKACYYKDIFLAKCKNQNEYLYFWDKWYTNGILFNLTDCNFE